VARSIAEFHRPHHRQIARLLRHFDAKFLADAGCFFGGGTQLALSLGEYRESRDIDFLCSRRAGFRAVRETVTNDSLGAIGRRSLALARDVRADRDGVRTFLVAGSGRYKLEIVFEGRIDLSGEIDPRLGLAVLTPVCAVAEKMLANADRGLDESTQSRDLIDLAFAAVHFGRAVVKDGMAQAAEAYGLAVGSHLERVLREFRDNRRHAAACIRSLGVDDSATLRKGLRVLSACL
jgi:hypothetical protein